MSNTTSIAKFYEKHKNELMVSLITFRNYIKNNREDFKDSVMIITNNTRDTYRIIDENLLLEAFFKRTK
ncbi:MAG: hypothetical protein U9N59_10100 [Campylobacterota bacterium]|nr:hypothetical protein [Campylobacterota bacterium]